MKILLSNDDGILAPGLAALYHAVKDLGEVTVVAPDAAQSGAGHAITIRKPLTVREVHVHGPSPFRGLSVSGSPADCVRLAMFNLLNDDPDLVLSGINAGANVGIHVFYSGTVAAAAEAAMYGIPAVAFSSKVEGGEVDFPRDATLCRTVLDHLLDLGVQRGDLLNVNIPSAERGTPRGVRVVPQSSTEVRDEYVLRNDEGPQRIFEIGSNWEAEHCGDTDGCRLAENYITVTPLHVDMTAHEKLDRLKQAPWPNLPE